MNVTNLQVNLNTYNVDTLPHSRHIHVIQRNSLLKNYDHTVLNTIILGLPLRILLFFCNDEGIAEHLFLRTSPRLDGLRSLETYIEANDDCGHVT